MNQTAMEEQMTDQQPVFEFLSLPGSYGLEGLDRVERIDTHISVLFLAGDRVYKVKKAVRFPFLDHRSLAAREAVCRKEVALNAPLAPGLYLDVVPINRTDDGQLSLGGAGTPVEWAVVQRRFEQSALLSNVIETEGLTRENIYDLAEALVRFHNLAPVVRARANWATETLENTLQSFGPYRAMLGEADAQTLESLLRQTLARITPLLTRRAEQGFVRRCHGDLHLGNIVMWRGRPTPFDAIDFNDMFVEIDVLYDLAFLLMDMDERGYRRDASFLLNHTFEFLDDVEGLAVLPFFLALRSLVRAFVSAATAESAADGPNKDAAVKTAKHYLQRAIRYLEPRAIRLVAIGGLSGSGKSRLARGIAPFVDSPLGAIVIRSDVIRKRLLGVGPYQPLPEHGYTPEISDQTYDRMLEDAEHALDLGFSVVLDGVFAKPDQRDAAERIATNRKIPFDGIWANTTTEAALKRINNRVKNASDATEHVRRMQEAYDLGVMTWHVLDTSSPSRRQTRDEALKLLGLQDGSSGS